MSVAVLVTYATTYGSTRDVAEVIATSLRQRGLVADALPVSEVHDLHDYSGVVVGAPIYIGKWHKDARDFVAAHQAALSGMPVAVFALGPLSNDAEEARSAREQLETVVASFGWLKPVAMELFGGKYDPAHLGFMHNLLAVLPASPLHGRPEQDARDWDTIRAWSGEVAGLMGGATLTASPA